MPIIKSAIKRAKQTIKRRERNVGIKRDIKDATKEFIAAPTAKNFSAAQSEIDINLCDNFHRFAVEQSRLVDPLFHGLGGGWHQQRMSAD